MCTKHIVFLFLLISPVLFAQVDFARELEGVATDLGVLNFDDLSAQDDARFEFYQGVNLFHGGNIAQSLLAFQKAISYSPLSIRDSNVYKYWYARANYAYGIPGVSNAIFKELIAKNFVPTYLSNKIEVIQLLERNLTDLDFSQISRAVSIDLKAKSLELPMTIRSLRDGSLGLTILKSNVVAIVNPTGVISRFLVKNFEALNRPTDLVQLRDGCILVSEFRSNSISQFTESGAYLRSFVLTGEAQNPEWDNNFFGPQYLATDIYDNVYVSTYGNAEVLKFASNGRYVLRFGSSSEAFMGLVQPTGILVIGDRVWVADYVNNSSRLVQFDSSGNYVDTHIFNSPERIESLQEFKDKVMMLVFHSRIVKFDTVERKIVDTLQDSEFSKLVSADVGVNGLLWIVDQTRNRLDIFSNVSNFYTGLHINTKRLSTTNFPQIRMEFSVEDSSGQAITGLDSRSISINEGGSLVSSFVVQENPDLVKKTEHIVFVPALDKTLRSKRIQERLKDSISLISEQAIGLSSATNEVILNLIVPSERLPIISVQSTTLPIKIITGLDENFVPDTSPRSVYDAVKLASNFLLQREGNKTIVFVGSIDIQDDQPWDNLSRVLEYHNITLLWIKVDFPREGQTQEDNSFVKTIRKSDGSIFQYPLLNQSEETSVVRAIFSENFGTYFLEFNSAFTIASTKQYVPLIITGHFYNSSGQEITGYVVPSLGN